ncbi:MULTISPECIES: hypothetical protein [Bartonella]|nr:hypothetical protein [Bartonella grahamii]
MVLVGWFGGGWFWGMIGNWRVLVRGKRLERTSARGLVSILWLEFFIA